MSSAPTSERPRASTGITRMRSIAPGNAASAGSGAAPAVAKPNSTRSRAATSTCMVARIVPSGRRAWIAVAPTATPRTAYVPGPVSVTAAIAGSSDDSATSVPSRTRTSKSPVPPRATTAASS
jgi:hypothetical protein